MRSNPFLRSALAVTVTISSICVVAFDSSAAELASPVIVERGPHHRVWKRTQDERMPGGRVITNSSSYVQLETGLHYKDPETGQWLDSSENIDIVDGFAVARQGQHRLAVAGNLNTPGAIDLFGPNGERFTSHILGLAYTDRQTGESVILARIKDCAGVVIDPNIIYFSDAFEGDLEADVRFVYTKAGFEQDIVLVVPPPSPNHYGLNPNTYLITGNVIVYGDENVIEGGTVVKFTNTVCRLWFKGKIDCRTSPWHPAIFTAVDDDSVGSVIGGSSGSPSGYYAMYAFNGEDTTEIYDLHDIRWKCPLSR